MNSISSKIIACIISSAFGLIYLFFTDRLKLPYIIILCLINVYIAVSFVLEWRANKHDVQLRKDIQSGEYHRNDEWREKYAEFVEKKGFENIKHKSMEDDLNYRFRRFFQYVMYVLAALTGAAALVIADTLDLKIVIALFALGFAGYGLYIQFHTPVKEFIRRCGDNLSVIEDSYLNGRLLTYKHSAAGNTNNCGVNIGDDYTVIYTSKEIVPLKNCDIISVRKRIAPTRYYGNSIYNGTVTLYCLDITVQRDVSSPSRTFSVDLREMQVDLAIETFYSLRIPTDYIGRLDTGRTDEYS